MKILSDENVAKSVVRALRNAGFDIKDIKDAQHLRLVFNNLDETKIKRYKSLFKQEFNRYARQT